jgi:RHS repeat-associated protein
VAEYSTQTPPQNPTTSYTGTDQLGSPRVITDSLGNVVSRRDFMPFGEEITNELSTNARPSSLKYGTADGIRQKFTGYQKDDETGLDFAEARMYENRHGRFTAVDPLLASGKSANPQTFNRYVYTLNNPINFIDPTGLSPDDYYIKNDGNIEVYRTDDNFDRFYAWDYNKEGYVNIAQLDKKEVQLPNGQKIFLVEFPQSGYGFTSYNSIENGKYVEPGGYDKNINEKPGEQTGVGDHWVRPQVAAALFGLMGQARNELGATIALGDMSSSNGSDPWNPKDTGWGNHGHHHGHGHLGDRSGLDIDWRYVDKTGVSQKASFGGKSPLDQKLNQKIFDLAAKWGFTENYAGTDSRITGMKKLLNDHNNHGHFGFGNLKVTELNYDRKRLNQPLYILLGPGLPKREDRIIQP